MGLNKTGTTTLGTCLASFGYDHISFAPGLLEAWAQGDVEPVLARAAGHESFEDWPWALAYRELDEHFPGSQFVLTVRRDPQTWLDSLRAHAERNPESRYRRLAYGVPAVDGHEEQLLDFYRRHNAGVRAHFRDRPDQLIDLCWELGDGWPELCEFLGVAEPKWPFPHENARTQAGSS